MGKKPAKKERYSIIITSLTDARKKPFVFSITKRLLISVISVIFVIVTASGLAAVFTSSQAVSSSAEADTLKARSDGQAELISSYSARLIQLKQYRYMNGIESEGMKSIYSEKGPVSQCPPALEQTSQPPASEAAPEGNLIALSPGTSAGVRSLGTAAAVSIPMTEAIEQINAEFQANIDKRIEEIKANEGFSEAEVVYNGSEDGDSEIVNNWADVLSIYAVITMRDELRFMTITPENLKLLKSIYNEMNQPSFYTKTTPYTAENDAGGRTEGITEIKLTIYVTVNSLTYSEDAELHDLNKKQKQKLELLMSPSWYTYFADVLGLDVYDGMQSEDIQAIISSLPEGEKGSEIVKTALIRLGHPYSNARRGSGNYVDCSYFTRWVYEQVGLEIPTSSVLQALYCYRNDYVVEKKDLKPGDLVFWSLKGCTRWRGIHHVGIYLGNNKVIEASSSRGRVVIRKLWSGTEWKLAFFARPYTEDEVEVSQPASLKESNDKEKKEN